MQEVQHKINHQKIFPRVLEWNMASVSFHCCTHLPVSTADKRICTGWRKYKRNYLVLWCIRVVHLNLILLIEVNRKVFTQPSEVSALYSTHLHFELLCWTSDSALIQFSFIQKSQSTTTTNTHTHYMSYDASPCPPPHTQKNGWTEICTVMPLFESVMPETLLTSHWAVTWERRVKLWENWASCIINMDVTLTLLVQLICESIPLAAVQTSPGFTVHWLLQNYSSSMQPNCREEPLLWTGAVCLWQAGWQRLTQLSFTQRHETHKTHHPLFNSQVHGLSTWGRLMNKGARSGAVVFWPTASRVKKFLKQTSTDQLQGLKAFK